MTTRYLEVETLRRYLMQSNKRAQLSDLVFQETSEPFKPLLHHRFHGVVTGSREHQDISSAINLIGRLDY